MRPSAPVACLLLYLGLSGGLAQGQNPSLEELSHEFHVEHNVQVPLRDGTPLAADIVRPRGPGRFPTLVYRTPYGKQNAIHDYTTFRAAAKRGYAVALVDVRGRYASGGDFHAYRHEGQDGYDTIEWAARQSWSDGNVGTFGLSYPGAVQWLAAVENPPHLKAMAPFMTFATPRNFFYSGGVWDGSWLDWNWNSIAPDVRVRRNLPGPRTYQEAIQSWKQRHAGMQAFLPLLDLPDLKDVSPFYYEWLQHSPWEPWWDWAELRDKYANVHAAVLNLSGWYDEAYGPDGATTNFNGLLRTRKRLPNSATRTIIGPWVHGVESTQTPKAGDRSFPPNAVLDYDSTVLDWMDHYLRGIDNGVEKQAPVRLYVMGDNVWRDEQAWPLARARSTHYYLSGSTSKSSRSGALGPAKPGLGSPSEFISDPAHPVSDPYQTLGGHDYSRMQDRPDVLTFDSAPLQADTEVTGPISAHIFVSSDVPDFDLWVRLQDVAPDGSAWNLMSPGADVQRLSYRNHSPRRELLQAGEVYEVRLEGLRTANVFKKGHRIRVQISAAFFPRFSRNLQTGELETRSAATRKATIRVYHDARYPSHLALPLIPRSR